MNLPIDAFIAAACVPLDGSSHASGDLAAANALLVAYPDLEHATLATAAILGNAAAVRAHLTRDPSLATAKFPPRNWDALTHLCFSRYLRLDPTRSAGFVAAATALLDAGANPNTGWCETDHQPHPIFESALYGAAGIAHHAELTRVLLARGADPNDDETPYHAPETYDPGVLHALVESGKLTAANLAIMLVRKADCHDHPGVLYLLQHGADPNHLTRWGITALHQSVRRDNAVAALAAFLDHRADPHLVATAHDRRSAAAIAARRGRADFLQFLTERGIPHRLTGLDELIAAIALDDGSTVSRLLDQGPSLLPQLLAAGPTLLPEFAGNGNLAGVRRLLDLGVPVDVRYPGDAYFGIRRDSTALHVASWRIRPPVVDLLLARDASPEATNAAHETPLTLAVRACVSSYWTDRRTPACIAALLAAGANPSSIPLPTGYPEADRLLSSNFKS